MAKVTNEGLINHIVGVRYRVTGSGNLRTIVKNLGSGQQELNTTIMVNTTPTMPFRLANFKAQGMQIEFKVSEIDEIFTISRIVAYTKPSATGYPQ